MRARSHSLRRGGATALVFVILGQATAAAAGPALDGGAVSGAATLRAAPAAPAAPARPAVDGSEHGDPGVASPAAPDAAKDPSFRSGKAAAEPEGIDPEPDVAIKPPAVTLGAEPLGADPLDAKPAKPVEAAKPADDPLPVLNAAIRRAIDRRAALEIRGPGASERRKEREAIGFFYLAHSFAPVWSADGAALPAAASVLARLAHAADDGLQLGAPAALKSVGSPDDLAESELALSEAVVAYARQASGSRIDPHTIAPLIGLRPALADAAEALETVAAAGIDAGDRLRDFNPIEPRYRALRDKLAELRAARVPMATSLSTGSDLKSGMRDPRVPLKRARISLDGTADGEPQALRYDVAAANAGLQKADGSAASGVITKRTVAALAGGRPSRLEGQLVANMEMWRWMPRDLGTDHVEVNIPDYVVTVFRDGVATSKNRVVVGKKDTPTPLFSNTMQVVIVNPVWNVPESIIKKEMLPKLAQDPDYLERLGYRLFERNGHLAVQQPSGERNALGRVKFIFPNDYAVYLHDTPSKALFATARRAYSHGCVRVDQPFRFAVSVLHQDKWSETRLTSLLGDTERHIGLPKPLPIHLEYFTATVDETGRLALRDDVYDYINRIAAALAQES